jgi:hypothetical protein
MPIGVGGLDAEGVWQYGEDDTETLASDLLGLGFGSVSTQFGIDRARLDDIEEDLYAIPSRVMRPSAVTGGTIAANGSFNSSSVSVVRPKGVFLAGLPRYHVKFDITTASNTTVNVMLSVNDTDTNTGYDQQRGTDINITAGAAQSLNLAVLMLNGGVNSTRHVGDLYFDTNPAAAAATYFRVETTIAPNPMTTAHGRYVGAGLQRATTAFDGFSFTAGSGNLTVNYCSVVGSI